MKVLVFGKTGQVATELGRRAPAGWKVTLLGRDAVDLSDADACAAAVAAADADLVINAAAWTAVDKAEAEEPAALAVNATAPGAMAQAAAARGLPFLHISTDYVFDGTGSQPWRVTDAPAPVGAYGRTKLAGENAVRDAMGADGRHVILRVSWVFSAHGSNFVRTMLRLGHMRQGDGGRLRVVADQVGGPTPAAAIADALYAIAAAYGDGRGVDGTFHLSGAPDVSWADFARSIMVTAGLDVPVDDIVTSDYPTPARRPENSRLDCSSLATAYGIGRPDWNVGLREVLTELGEIG